MTYYSINHVDFDKFIFFYLQQFHNLQKAMRKTKKNQMVAIRKVENQKWGLNS